MSVNAIINAIKKYDLVYRKIILLKNVIIPDPLLSRTTSFFNIR
jgi:hypothetical protein